MKKKFALIELFIVIAIIDMFSFPGEKRFGKGRAREGKDLSSKGFSFSHLAFA